MQSLQLIRALAHVVSGGTKAFVIKRCEERGHHRQTHKTLSCYLFKRHKTLSCYSFERHKPLSCYMFELEKENVASAS